MITVRVFLKCAAASNRPGSTFDTFVAVDEPAFLRGGAIAIAERRARILGYEPFEVIEVRRIGAPAMSVDDVREKLIELSKAPLGRCLRTIDLHEQQVASSNSSETSNTVPRLNRRRRTSGR